MLTKFYRTLIRAKLYDITVTVFDYIYGNNFITKESLIQEINSY